MIDHWMGLFFVNLINPDLHRKFVVRVKMVILWMSHIYAVNL